MKQYTAVPDGGSKRADLASNESKLDALLTNGKDILIMRRHTGDENGPTECEFSKAKVIDCETGKVVNDVEFFLDEFAVQKFAKQSNSEYLANDRVAVGRLHTGDENGPTQWIDAAPKLRIKDDSGMTAKELTGKIMNVTQIGPFKESDGTRAQSQGQFLIGQFHSGDENGPSTYFFGTIIFEDC